MTIPFEQFHKYIIPSYITRIKSANQVYLSLMHGDSNKNIELGYHNTRIFPDDVLTFYSLDNEDEVLLKYCKKECKIHSLVPKTSRLFFSVGNSEFCFDYKLFKLENLSNVYKIIGGIFNLDKYYRVFINPYIKVDENLINGNCHYCKKGLNPKSTWIDNKINLVHRECRSSKRF